MHLSSRLFWFTVCCFWMRCVLPADTEIQTHFRILVLNPVEHKTMRYLSAGKPVEVKELSPLNRSNALAYSGPATFTLYSSDPALPQPKILAQVVIPQQLKIPLLILRKNTTGKGLPFHGQVIDDDPSTFPFPSTVFINLTQQNLSVESVDDQTFVLEPAQQKTLTSTQTSLNITLSVPRKNNAGWRLIYDNFFPNWPDQRTLMLITETESQGRSIVHPLLVSESKTTFEQQVAEAQDE